MKKFHSLLVITIIVLFSTSVHAQRVFELMETDGVNLKEVQDEAATYFATVGTGKGTGYKLFKRWEYNAQMNLQSNGMVVSEKAQAAAARAAKQAAAVQGAKMTSPSHWTELGPLVIPESKGTSGIGRITAIYVEPVQQQLIYAGSPGGGLWKSSNGGNSWTPLGDDFENMNIYAVEADPTNTNIVYVGNSWGQLLKSTNGGLSFDATPLLDGSGVLKDILINPENTNDIYAAVVNDGLYHTTNGGSSWTKVIDADIEDVLFKPGATAIIYACGDDFYRSTNGGTSFTKVTSGIEASYRMKMAVSPANSSVVYIVQKQASGFGHLYRSTDSGVNFTVQAVRGDVDYIGVQAFRDMAIAVSDTNIDEVHIGGWVLYKSMDGGVSFERETYPSLVGSTLPRVHADTEVLQYIDGVMYVGSDGGIDKTTDAGASFTELTTGLGVQQFYRIAISASNKNKVMGGSQDNGTAMLSRDTQEWTKITGGDGMNCMIDPNNENIFYSTSQWGDLWAAQVYEGGARKISRLNPPEHRTGHWITPFAMDPNKSSRIYVGYSNLYYHNNGGIDGDKSAAAETWVNASENITFPSKLAYIVNSPSNSDVMYVATLSGVYKSTDVTSVSPTWTQLTPGIQGNIIGLAVDPYDENRIALSMSYGVLLLSTDGGITWTSINDGLPEASIRTIVFDRSPDKGIYAGVAGAVFYKSDRVPNWTVFSDNLPNVRITELELYYDKEAQEDSRIRVATYGRGIWESPLYDSRELAGNSCVSGFSNPYTTIEAEALCLQSGVEIEADGKSVGYIESGDYIKLNAVAFGNIGAKSFQANVASATSGGIIEIHLDAPDGPLVGRCIVSGTDGWSTWADVSCDISGAMGDHDVYLVFTGSSGYLFNLNSFGFEELDICEEPINAFTTIEAEDYCDQSGVALNADGKSIGYIENGDYIKFNNVDFGLVAIASFFEANVASAGSGGDIEIRLDSPTGRLLGSCTVRSTARWTNWVDASCSIERVIGTHDVYLVFTGGEGYLFNVNSFGFTMPTLNAALEPVLESESDQVLLFPNPVQTTMHLQLRTAGEMTKVSLATILGEVVKTATFDTHQGLNLLKMNIEGLSSGFYNVIILKGKTTLNKTMVIE